MKYTYSKVKLRNKYLEKFQKGYLNYYKSELKEEDLKEIEPGQICNLVDENGNFLARGICNPLSKISFRVLTFNENEEINRDFFYKKLKRAIESRGLIYPDNEVLRLIYGEIDMLPGLIVDKYGNCIVVRNTTAGIEKWMSTILDLLDKIIRPEVIILRNDSKVRELEGLKLYKEVVKGKYNSPHIVNYQNLRIGIDCLRGRKTGLFLDHRENQRIFSNFNFRNRDVLDAYCYIGLWGLIASKKGAKSVIGIDSDDLAIELAKFNAKLNNLTNIEFIKGNVDNYLNENVASRDKLFDFIVLDPPAFIKRKRYLKKGIKGYYFINDKAIKLLKDYGILVTSSCSSFINEFEFEKILNQIGLKNGLLLKILYRGFSSLDHPHLWQLNETNYLKTLFIQVICKKKYKIN